MGAESFNIEEIFNAARPEAEALVERLWEELSDWDSVALAIRDDASLKAPVRHAALNTVLRRATSDRKN